MYFGTALVSMAGALHAQVATGGRDAAAITARLQASEKQEDDFSSRGFLGAPKDTKILDSSGRVVWDTQLLGTFDDESRKTVNTQLWYQARLLSKSGIFRVTDGVYQVRGLDAANMTVIEGKSGYILIDPLGAKETAAAALKLVRGYLGDKPVVAVIYTHPHPDHYGGSAGVVPMADGHPAVPVIAPTGFNQAVLDEQVLLGNAIGRRGQFQFGKGIGMGPKGSMGAGIAVSIAQGQLTLVPPTVLVDHTGEKITVDGIELEFQLTPGTEAPAEMNIYIAGSKVLCLAENAAPTMHNLLPPRGAEVRDARAWSQYLDEAEKLFASRSDYVVLSHGWPRFGREPARQFIEDQSDLYRFMHDQTVRMINNGLKPDEIAETFALPDGLADKWYDASFYGSLKFNVRAIYQRYIGFYDGDPAHLDPLPPVVAGRKFVAAVGGAQRVIDQATLAAGQGDLRWAAEMLDHLVVSDPANQPARTLLADVYTRMGYGSQNAVWRNIYLTGAAELRKGAVGSNILAGNSNLFANISATRIFDILSTRVDPDKAAGLNLSVRVQLSDTGEDLLVSLRNSVLRSEKFDGQATDASLSMPKQSLVDIVRYSQGLSSVKSDRVSGDQTGLAKLFSVFKRPDPSFPVVTSVLNP
jgi:alkyl sulfatase BDS1-like metallo-beta-lactamase superfamily hydrolase